jgi:hypothetical protein
VALKVLGLDLRCQQYRQDFFPKLIVINIDVKLQVILSSSFIQLSESGVLSVFLKMDKIVYRAVIKFFVTKRANAK